MRLAVQFATRGITILSEGEIDGPTIDKEKYIDQHYYAIASKATLKEPKELAVPADKFKEFFDEEWDTVLKEDRAHNAIKLQSKFEWDEATLNEKWDATKDKRAPPAHGTAPSAARSAPAPAISASAFLPCSRMCSAVTPPQASSLAAASIAAR